MQVFCTFSTKNPRDICFPQVHELIQVECYLRSEGVLVRYWYPIDMLERPPAGYRKAPIVGHQALSTSNIHLHRYVKHTPVQIHYKHIFYFSELS